MNNQPTKRFSNGVEIPIIGLCVYKMTNPEETLQAIESAIVTGYPHIDTASMKNK